MAQRVDDAFAHTKHAMLNEGSELTGENLPHHHVTPAGIFSDLPHVAYSMLLIERANCLQQRAHDCRALCASTMERRSFSNCAWSMP